MTKYEINSNRFGAVLRVCGKWHKSLENVLQQNGIKQIQLWYSDGWRGKDLDFLKGLPNLEGLSVWDASGLDVSAVSSVSHLKRLLVKIWDKTSHPIAFEKLTNLQSCEMEWNSAFESVLYCTSLRRIEISDVKKISSLSLEKLVNLSEIWLTRLSGVKKIELPAGNSVSQIILRKIPSLREILSWSSATSLTRLWLTECKMLEVSEISAASALKILDLHNMGVIPSLKFVKSLRSLENLTLFGRTEVADGKIAFILDLPKLETMTFPPKSHYDITPQKAREILTRK